MIIDCQLKKPCTRRDTNPQTHDQEACAQPLCCNHCLLAYSYHALRRLIDGLNSQWRQSFSLKKNSRRPRTRRRTLTTVRTSATGRSCCRRSRSRRSGRSTKTSKASPTSKRRTCGTRSSATSASTSSSRSRSKSFDVDQLK